MHEYFKPRCRHRNAVLSRGVGMYLFTIPVIQLSALFLGGLMLWYLPNAFSIPVCFMAERSVLRRSQNVYEYEHPIGGQVSNVQPRPRTICSGVLVLKNERQGTSEVECPCLLLGVSTMAVPSTVRNEGGMLTAEVLFDRGLQFAQTVEFWLRTTTFLPLVSGLPFASTACIAITTARKRKSIIIRRYHNSHTPVHLRVSIEFMHL